MLLGGAHNMATSESSNSFHVPMRSEIPPVLEPALLQNLAHLPTLPVSHFPSSQYCDRLRSNATSSVQLVPSPQPISSQVLQPEIGRRLENPHPKGRTTIDDNIYINPSTSTWLPSSVLDGLANPGQCDQDHPQWLLCSDTGNTTPGGLFAPKKLPSMDISHTLRSPNLAPAVTDQQSGTLEQSKPHSAQFCESHKGTHGPEGNPGQWTKYIGVKRVLGKGTVHMYENGHNIPTHINTRPVNPAWGLTKANEPRKRSAIACMRCRQRKMRCEPGLHGCRQCRKDKHHCIIDSQPYFRPGSIGSRSPRITASSRVEKERNAPSPLQHEHSTTCRPVQVLESLTEKRRTGPMPPSNPSAGTSRSSDSIGSSALWATDHMSEHTSTPRRDSLTLETDPYCHETYATIHTLNLFFAHVNNIYHIFLRWTFEHWVINEKTKSANELMVLFAILGLGSCFAADRFLDFGRRCAEIAARACGERQEQLTVFDVQAKMLLGQYYQAHGQGICGWDYGKSALQAALHSRLRLNTEDDLIHDGQCNEQLAMEFSFTDQQIAECKRRTFWSCLIIDRTIEEDMYGMNSQDITLRLPCEEDAYERSRVGRTPFFNNGIIDPRYTSLQEPSRISPMAWLSIITAIGSEVQCFTRRMKHAAPQGYRKAYKTFHEATQTSLADWVSQLPEYLQYEIPNIDRSVHGGYAVALSMIHALYHFTLMKLNRCLRYKLLPELIERNTKNASFHALAVLSMLGVLQKGDSMRQDFRAGRTTDNLFLSPSIGDIVTFAVDIVTARGNISDINSMLERVQQSIVVLTRISKYWNSSKEQLRRLQVREKQLQELRSQSQDHPLPDGLWRLDEPLSTFLEQDNDCMYLGATDISLDMTNVSRSRKTINIPR